MRRLTLSLWILLTTFAVAARAELQLPGIFSDNMVLQQEAAVPVWGWADNGDKVTVTFRGQTVSTTAKNGKWSVKLRKLKAGGPDTLSVTTKTQTLQFTNVLVGEVWICSGQSNMEWALGKSFEPDAALASATNSMIRLFTVPNTKSDVPRTNVYASWQTCSPLTATRFSAVGYYFGRELQKHRGVPIGLLDTDWGGTPAEAWTRREVLQSRPRYKAEIYDAYDKTKADNAKKSAEFKAQKELAAKENREFTNTMARLPNPWKPSELYNGMISPIIPYAFRGVIWYQGESNAERAEQYRTLFPDMIRNWRHDWDQGDFPFLFVQIAPWDKDKKRPLDEVLATPTNSDWAELREAQLLTSQTVRNTGMIVITDYGEKDDIHPRRKQPVGERLALLARAAVYDENIPYSGPIYRSMKARDGKIIVRFDHVGQGLEARDGAPKGFAICGEDKKWVWATAEIQPDNTIAVSNPVVAKPIAVRYGWADYPVVNLFNKDGFPASPFRTDDFPLTTGPKK